MSEEEKQSAEEVIESQPVDAPAEPSGEEKPVEAPAEEGGDSDSPPAEAAEYVPNLNFKANNKEMQFDDWIKAALTNPEQEARVRELYEKAYGLDEIKPRAEATLKEYNEYRQQNDPVLASIEDLKQNVAVKDWDTFFKNTNIPKEWIFEWVQDKLKYQQMTPEDQATHDNHWNTRREASSLENERDHYRNQAENAMVDQRSQELDYELAKPEVNQAMQSFDQRMGRVGAFYSEVVARGQTAYANGTGRDISAKEAVEGVLSLMGHVAQQEAGVPSSPVVGASTHRDKPIIPNIRGRGTSPVRKQVRSLDDIREIERNL